MAHKTDFKDALFEQRKYRMQNNPDGTVTPFDETEYTQVGDRVGAKEFNEIGAALNSLEGKMGERNLQTYTALSQLSLEAPVIMAQIFEAMPNNSYAVIDANGSNTITDAPVSGSGIVEISKINGGRNFARFTKSLSSQTVGMTMWYGTFSWADTTVFSGWKRLLEEDDALETMEEIEANTDAGKAAGALAVKELSSELKQFVVAEFTIEVNTSAIINLFDLPAGITYSTHIPVFYTFKTRNDVPYQPNYYCFTTNHVEQISVTPNNQLQISVDDTAWLRGATFYVFFLPLSQVVKGID